MSKYRSLSAGSIPFAVIVIAISGCGMHARLASQLATPNGPIAVEATVDGRGEITASLDNNVPNVTVHFGDNRQVVVEMNRILVDGEAYPGIPPGTQKIDINIAKGHVTIKADGHPLTK